MFSLYFLCSFFFFFCLALIIVNFKTGCLVWYCTFRLYTVGKKWRCDSVRPVSILSNFKLSFADHLIF